MLASFSRRVASKATRSFSFAPITELSPAELEIKASAEDFAKTYIAPKVAEMDRTGKMDAEYLKQVRESGFLAIEVPEKYGGLGASFTSVAVAVQAFTRYGDASSSLVIDVANSLFNNAIMIAAKQNMTPIIDEVLSNVAQGQIGAFGLTEPTSGSDAFAMKSRAVRDGDNWRLTGEKCFITNSGYADMFVIFANAAPEKGFRGITAFLVKRDELEISPDEVKHGIRASSTCSLYFDVVIPHSRVLGNVGEGYKICMAVLNEGRIGISAQSIGIAEAAMDIAAPYLLERKQFGKPLIENQVLQFAFAENLVKLEAAKALMFNACRLKDAGLPFAKEAAMSKYYASTAAEEIASEAMSWMGGNGFMVSYGIEKLVRDTKILRVYEGTSNMLKQTVYKYGIKEYEKQ